MRCDAGDVAFAAGLPDDWVSDRLRLIAPPSAPPTAIGAVAAHAIDLGGGIHLAHLRLAGSEERLAAIAAPGTEAWLGLVALLPDDEPARHLRRLARLAAALSDGAARGRLRAAADPATLAAALVAALPARAPNSAQRLVLTVVKRPEVVDRLLASFVEHGVPGATVIEARGMGEHLTAHQSLFAGFKQAFRASGASQLVLALVPASRTDEILALARAAAGGMGEPGAGIAWAMDVAAAVGLDKDA